MDPLKTAATFVGSAVRYAKEAVGVDATPGVPLRTRYAQLTQQLDAEQGTGWKADGSNRRAKLEAELGAVVKTMRQVHPVLYSLELAQYERRGSR